MTGHKRRRLRVAVTAVVFVLGFLCVGVGPASAHAALILTSPIAGSELGAPPTVVSLVFSEAVGFNARSVQVLDADGQRVDEADVADVGGDPRTVGVTLPRTLPKGSYVVVWHVVSADSHPVGGTFSFGYGVPAGMPPPPAGVDPLLAWSHAVFRFGALAGTVVLVGVTFFLVAVWRAGLALVRVRALLVGAWAVTAVSTTALFLLEGPYGASLSLADLSDLSLVTVTFGTTYGKLLLLRLVALAGAASVWPAVRRDRRPPGRLDAFGIGLLVVESFSFAGHAGQGDLTPLATSLDAAHMTAAGVWLGGLSVLGTVLLRPPDEDDVRSLVRALPLWSRVAMTSVAAIVLTGAYQAWREVGSLDALLGTRYGRLVVAKIALLALLLVLANAGRAWVQKQAEGPATQARPATSSRSLATATGVLPSRIDAAPPALARLRRTVLAELLLGVAVIAVTAALVNSVPAQQDYVPDVGQSLIARDPSGDTLRVQLRVTPARAGLQNVTIAVTTTDGAAMPFGSADGSLSAPDLGLGPIEFALQPGGPGVARAVGVVVPSSGLWHLVVNVRVDAFTDYAVQTTYPVR